MHQQNCSKRWHSGKRNKEQKGGRIHYEEELASAVRWVILVKLFSWIECPPATSYLQTLATQSDYNQQPVLNNSNLWPNNRFKEEKKYPNSSTHFLALDAVQTLPENRLLSPRKKSTTTETKFCNRLNREELSHCGCQNILNPTWSTIYCHMIRDLTRSANS
jgi:hypothetical protein